MWQMAEKEEVEEEEEEEEEEKRATSRPTKISLFACIYVENVRVHGHVLTFRLTVWAQDKYSGIHTHST